jgi:hypothetical protein
MLLKFGSIVTDASGSVAGLTIARNRGGAYARARTSPIQPNSTRQAAIRGIFAAAINSWTNLLSVGQRQMWEAYASAVPYTNAFGETRYYSGQQRYSQCYIAAVNAGRSVSSVAQAPTTYTEAEGIVISNMAITESAATPDSSAVVSNTLAPSAPTAGDTLLIHFGAPVTAATNFFKGPFRFAGSADFVSGTTYPDATLADPFGRTMASGLRVPCKFRILQVDNRISPETMGILTVATFSV